MNINPAFIPVIIVAAIWTFFWKAIALWKASQNKQKLWFVVLFVTFPVNTLGILELLYLTKFAKKQLTFSEVKSWFRRS